MSTITETSFIFVAVSLSIISFTRTQIPNSLLVPFGSELFGRCTCGKMRDMEAAKQGDFPWTAALVNKDDITNDPLCWGTIINSRYILSVAHCASKYKSTNVDIFIASSSFMFNPRREVSNIKNHPGFTRGNYTYDNDISLIKLRESLDLEAGDVYPVCLPPLPWTGNYTEQIDENDECNFEKSIQGATATMNKWKGYRTDGIGRSYRFNQSDLTILTTNKCTTLYPNRVKAQTVCGEAHHGLPWNLTKTNCHGDPGAPLLYVRKMKAKCDKDFEEENNDNMQIKYTQIGLSTAQRGCRGFSDSKPTLLYTKLTRYIHWIYENTMDGMYCANSKTYSQYNNII